jgi:hypothetical protein
MPLSIPTGEEKPLEELTNLPGTSLSRVVSTLSEARALLPVSELASLVAERAGLSLLVAERSVRLLVTLYLVADTYPSSGEFLQELFAAMAASGRKNLKFSPERAAELKNFFESALSSRTLIASARALEVAREFQNRFCEARIFSDLRPIFVPGPEPKPVGAIITHTLKLAYHEGDEKREVFITLDARQISDLKDSLGEALSNESALKTSLGPTQLPLLPLEENR